MKNVENIYDVTKTHQKRRDGTKTVARVGQSAVISTQSSVYGHHVRFKVIKHLIISNLIICHNYKQAFYFNW